MKIELVKHEGFGYYWLMDSYRLGWLVSKTYVSESEAVSALAENKTEWVEQELKSRQEDK